ncbi:nucleotide-binding protein [Bacillus sp. TH44]|uniref:TIR domain-containing protein n=1 Tax=Bacillus sp. TH45 TaxID=2796409 RepID=UPI001912FB33|nr:nucleotide-binding protein [Bacillus sp. TH45]MBK5346093.1 nucleotide-binding protein [Bacillus sp. TH45]MBK5360183.1 nucleotide-binding protein [Bacillus sp. TH44]MBK5362232.1 nucleotide-binding protein [Bacillus sp. TH50]
MYYHIRVYLKSGVEEERYNMLIDELETRYLSNYRNKKDFIFNGRLIKISDIEKIQINQSGDEWVLDNIVHEIELEDSRSHIAILGGPSIKSRAADRLPDVSDKLLLGPPGYLVEATERKEEKGGGQEMDNKKVFIVHGHDENLKQQLEIFLSGIGLKPIVLHREANQGRTIIEKFEAHSDVKYAFVLLTPDDIGCSVKDKDQPVENYKFRARQNVVFELGFFIGKLGRANVCSLYVEGVELPNDISGLVYQKVNNNIEDVGFHIIKELKAAGLEVQI